MEIYSGYCVDTTENALKKWFDFTYVFTLDNVN